MDSYGGKNIYIELNVDTDDFKKKAEIYTNIIVLEPNESFEL